MKTTIEDHWILILNPKAGRGKAGKMIPKIETILQKKSIKYKLIITENPKHAESITEKKITSGYRRFAAIGGDGTINEVVNGIMKSGISEEITFGIIPLGGGNDYVKSAFSERNLESSIESLKSKFLRKIDVGKIENFYFINSFGLGFDAVAAHYASEIKILNSLTRYLFAVLKTLFTFKGAYIKMKFNNEIREGRFLMVSVLNGKFIGGGFKVAPDAKIDSGVFVLSIIKEVSKLRILKLLPSVISGKHVHEKEVSICTTNKIEFSSAETIPVYFDGELPKLKNPNNFSVEIIPKTINLIGSM